MSRSSTEMTDVSRDSRSSNKRLDSHENDLLSSDFGINRHRMVASMYIIVTEFCERVAYYGFAGSVVLFFQQELNMNNADADIQFNLWSGMAYTMPLLGGYIADKYLGRYLTILVFCVIYVIGLVVVVIGAHPDSLDKATFFLGMYIVAIGTGGIKPNVSTLGADQFDERFPIEKKEKESFFNYFYWSINLGACFSYTVVAYVCQYGLPYPFGGEDYRFFVGYMIPVIMMTFAIVIFVMGTKRYFNTGRPDKGSRLEQVFLIVYEALWTRRKDQLPITGHKLDKACSNYGGSFTPVEIGCVKLLARISPFLCTFVAFWAIYSQMSTGFQNQGCQMNNQMGDAEIPVATMQMFDTIAILVCVPIMDLVLLPYLRRIDREPTMLQKVGIGFIFASTAMFVAGLVEYSRRAQAQPKGLYSNSDARNNISPCANIDDYNPNEYLLWEQGGIEDEPAYCSRIAGCTASDVTCISCDEIPQMSKLSIFAQIPQFTLIGIAEVFASIASLEFFYSQAPSSMRSVTQACNLFTTALGAWIGVPILFICNSWSPAWVPEDLDEGYLDYYFYLLAIMMVFNIMFLQYLSKDYRYVTQEELADLDEVLPLTADTENSSDSNNDSRNSSGVGTDHSVIPSSMKNHSNNNIGSISDGVSPLHKRNNRVQERSDGSGEDDSATLLK